MADRYSEKGTQSSGNSASQRTSHSQRDRSPDNVSSSTSGTGPSGAASSASSTSAAPSSTPSTTSAPVSAVVSSGSTSTTAVSAPGPTKKDRPSPSPSKEVVRLSFASMTPECPASAESLSKPPHKKSKRTKKKNATEEALEVLRRGPLKFIDKTPTQSSEKSTHTDEYMPIAKEAKMKSVTSIIGSVDETAIPLVAAKTHRIAEMVKTAMELETAIAPDEAPSPKPGALESAFIPVSFTTKGYIPTDIVSSTTGTSKASKTNKTSPKKKDSAKASLSTVLDQLDQDEKAGNLANSSGTSSLVLGIDGIGSKYGSAPSSPSPKTRLKRHGISIVEDLSKCEKLNVEDMIQKLMSSVAADGKVKDHLTDVGLIEQICVLAIENLKNLPSMLEIQPKIHIVGDLHGQFSDLLRIFERCGNPNKCRYLFLGDYVDRGPNSLETICLLLLLRVKYPNNVFMLRGNHECSAINRVYGFYDECEDRFQQGSTNETIWGAELQDMKGSQVWYRFQDVFNWLPLTAIVGKKILCMHGGLSPDLQSVDQLRALERPIDPEVAGLHVDLLWSDPDPNMPAGENDVDWGPSARGISSHFNVRAVNSAIARLNLDMIVRAHQVVQDGYEFFANRKLVTIFSAPNYCGEYNNSGAIMIVHDNLGISFEIIAPSENRPSKKKSKSTEVNFDDIDLDALIAEGSAEKC